MAFRAPLLGYNTNVRHKGKLFHIQTEDSGIDHPHVLTHLFADGGRVVASKKTSYADRVGADGLQDIVKKLMQGQHKAMFIALRDGVYDEDESEAAEEATSLRQPTPVAAEAAAPLAARAAGGGDQPAQDEDAQQLEPETLPPMKRQGPPSAVFKAPKQDPVIEKVVAKSPAAPRSLFGADLMSDKGLDEVILNYLAANEKDG
jgi:hypothetical protein